MKQVKGEGGLFLASALGTSSYQDRKYYQMHSQGQSRT